MEAWRQGHFAGSICDFTPSLFFFPHWCKQPFRIVSGSGDSETSDSESESDPDVEAAQLVKPVPLRPAQIGLEEINRMLMEARKAAEVHTN